MSDFKREVRYTVIKHNQLTDTQVGFLKNCIYGEGIPTVEAVVIESDWPEYEPVWKMIEDRVTGAPVEGGKAEYDAMALTKDKTVTMSRELAENLLHCGVTSSFITPSMTAELRAILAAPIVEAGGMGEAVALATLQEGWKDEDRTVITDPIEAEEYNRQCYDLTPLYASQPAPVSMVIDERAEFEKALIARSERFNPNLTRRGPHPDAEYQITSVQGDWEIWQARACLYKVKELNQ